MQRRDFVLAAAAAAAALTRRTSTPIPPGGALRFGYAAITWGGNDVAAIDDIAALGFKGIQLRASAVERWGTRPAELRALLADRRLTLVALSSGTLALSPRPDDDTFALHLANARFVRDVGGHYLQVVDERPAGRAPSPDDFTRMGRRLTELGKRTADLGVALGYHNHMGNLGQGPDEVARVLDAADPRFVKLELDIAHYQAAGGDPVAAVRQYRDRLLFLHLKDLVQPAPGGAPGSYEFVELGEGRVDVLGVLEALRQTGFDGWGIVELDRVSDPSRTPKTCAMTSRAYLTAHGYSL